MKHTFLTLLAATAIGAFSYVPAHSCACGCGVFEVGSSALMPTMEGGLAYVEADFMNQHRNWSGTNSADAANNDDKQIRTRFYSAGVQYSLNRNWAVEGSAPYWDRHFKTTDDTGAIVDFSHAALGDVRLKATYMGLSPDMSRGLTFGVKLPTGDSAYANFDPDTEIGTGSTDALLGGYITGPARRDRSLIWYANALADIPALHKSSYRPGAEIDGSLGMYVNGWTVAGARVAPLIQLIGGVRGHDGGSDSDPANTGYERVLLSPGVEVHAGGYRFYADVEYPIYQNVSGNQLVTTEQFKFSVGRYF